MTPKELSGFLRLLSHDLQNQIGAVDLNLQILPTLLDHETETAKEIEPFISRASLAASEMIETLSDIQRYAYSLADTHISTTAQVDLPTLLRDILLNLAPKAHARGLVLSLGESAEGTLQADREAVMIAVRLFAGEAIRSSFPGSTLNLSSSSPQSSTDSKSGAFSITLHASQEGLFESHRPTLASFLATEVLKPSNVTIQYFSGESRSIVRFVFP